MSAGQYGILSITSTISGLIFPLICLGLPGAVTRFYFDFGDPKQRRRYLGTVWVFLISEALVLTALLDQLCPLLANRFFRNMPFDPYVRLTLWTTFLSIFSTIPLELLRVRSRPFMYSLLTTGRFVLSLLLTIYFVVVLREEAVGALKGLFWANSFFALICLLFTARHVQIAFHWEWIVQSLTFGLPLVPHALAYWVVSLADRAILQRYVGLDEVGIYSLAQQLAMVLGLVISGLNNALVPFLFARSKATDARKLFSRIATYYVAVVVGSALLIAFFAESFILFFSPPHFRRAAEIVPVIVLGYLFFALYHVPANNLCVAKRSEFLPIVSLSAAVVNVMGNILAVPRFGILAAAWASLAGYLVYFLGAFIIGQRVYPLEYEYWRILKVFLCTILLFGARRILRQDTALLDISINAVLIFIFPCLLYIVRFFSRSEKQMIRDAISAVLPRQGLKS
jgi:O-antigen/teichoic acid export membrane protein